MRPLRTFVIATATVASLVATTGVAHAVFSDEVLLTAAEAQAAARYPSALTAQSMPATVPGLLIRMFQGQVAGAGAGSEDEDASESAGMPDGFTIMVIDPQGGGGSESDSKTQSDKAINQAKDLQPDLKCKVYENKNPKFTTVCWGGNPAEVLSFSSTIKSYSKKVKKGKKTVTVVFKRIPVLATSEHYTPGGREVTEADRQTAADQTKGLRDAQVAKLPATYS